MCLLWLDRPILSLQSQLDNSRGFTGSHESEYCPSVVVDRPEACCRGRSSGLVLAHNRGNDDLGQQRVNISDKTWPRKPCDKVDGSTPHRIHSRSSFTLGIERLECEQVQWVEEWGRSLSAPIRIPRVVLHRYCVTFLYRYWRVHYTDLRGTPAYANCDLRHLPIPISLHFASPAGMMHETYAFGRITLCTCCLMNSSSPFMSRSVQIRQAQTLPRSPSFESEEKYSTLKPDLTGHGSRQMLSHDLNPELQLHRKRADRFVVKSEEGHRLQSRRGTSPISNFEFPACIP